MNLTEEQILALAPDEASKKSGRDLANLAKWQTKNANEFALWGECQGSGSKPYQTQIDVINIAFKCSCPSRKFPCKHGLGLMLLYARNADAFGNVEPPAWVSEWLNKRTEKQEKQTEKKEKPVDEVAQQKRQQARHQKINDGIEELQRWIKDIIRNGMIQMPEKGYAWFEHMAKRMIDAQAPGLAVLVRSLGETNFFTSDWQDTFLKQLVSIYLTTEGFKNIANLDANIQDDIRSLIGFTQSQEELKEQTGITDTWLVLAKKISEQDNITTERYWLYGSSTNRYALILQFLVRGQGGQTTLTPGMFVKAELVFYASAIPMRAIIKRQLESPAATGLSTFTNWKEITDWESEICSVLPLRFDRPYIVRQISPLQYNNEWCLRDRENNIVQMKSETKTLWKLLAFSGGDPLDMVVIGKENCYEPLGTWHQGRYQIL